MGSLPKSKYVLITNNKNDFIKKCIHQPVANAQSKLKMITTFIVSFVEIKQLEQSVISWVVDLYFS